jgi:hypothetical protein
MDAARQRGGGGSVRSFLQRASDRFSAEITLVIRWRAVSVTTFRQAHP